MMAKRCEPMCVCLLLLGVTLAFRPLAVAGAEELARPGGLPPAEPQRGDADGHDHDHGDGHHHDHEADQDHGAGGGDAAATEVVAHRARERALWKAFVRSLYSSGEQDLLPEPLRRPDGTVAEGDEALLDFDASDPIKGVLFRASLPLIELDAAFQRARGEALPEKELEVARRHAGEIEDSENPYLEAYGQYYGARLDIQEEKYDDARERLRLLEASPHFLPTAEVRRLVVECYIAGGQTTLALLDLQTYLSTLGPEREAERAWGLARLKELRAEHPGPLKESGARMRSISELLAQNEIGEQTREQQEEVELVLEKIVEFLEAPRCPACGSPKCPDCGRRKCSCQAGVCKPCKGCKLGPGTSGKGAGSGSGSGSGGSQGSQGQGQGQRGEDGVANGNTPGGGPAGRTSLRPGSAAEADLRDASAAEREAWGRINDRKVARSLRELWDKIPRSYRLMVTQYFRDLSDLEPVEAAGGGR